MATWSPASIRRSGCWADKRTAGHSSRAAIQRAFMRGLLQRESVDGATGAARGVFQDRAAGWIGGAAERLREPATPKAKVRGVEVWGSQGPRAGGAAGSRNYRVPLSALTSPHARMASLARRLPAVVRGRDARAGLLAAVVGRCLP